MKIWGKKVMVMSFMPIQKGQTPRMIINSTTEERVDNLMRHER